MKQTLTFAIATAMTAGISSAALNLTPGSLIVSSSTNGVLRQVDPVTGVVLSSLQVRTASGVPFSSLLAVTVVSNEVYALDGDRGGRINTTTGTFTPLFQDFGDGLGSLNGNLITSSGTSSIATWSTTGTLLSTTMLDLATAGISDVSWRLRDVAIRGTHFAMLYETEADALTDFSVYNFRQDGSYVGTSVNYIRPNLYLAQGFDIDPANNSRWVALRRWDDFNSQLRLYDQSNINAIRTFTVNFGAVSDVAIVPIPAPASVALLGLAASLAHRRKRV